MAKFLFVWAVLATASMLFYGFTGVGFWSPLQGSNDFFRFAILFIFHVSGPFSFLLYKTYKTL